MNRDIDDRDWTGELAKANDRESLDLNVETAAHRASGDSRDRKAGTRRGTASTGKPKTHARAAARDQLAETKDSSDTSDKAGKRQRSHLEAEEPG